MFCSASSIATGERLPWDELSDDSDDELSETGTDTESAVQELPDPPATTELEQILSFISENVSCLLRLSLAIQNPAPHDRFLNSGRLDTSHFEPYDINHVRSKFPSTDGWLVKRLGKAISRRRQYLKYRDQHHAKRTRDAPDDRTVASSLPTEAKRNPTFAVQIDDDSDTGISQTSFATTKTGGYAALVPKMPDAAQDGKFFECPLCFTMTVVRSRIQWKYVILTLSLSF